MAAYNQNNGEILAKLIDPNENVTIYKCRVLVATGRKHQCSEIMSPKRIMLSKGSDMELINQIIFNWRRQNGSSNA
jgi:hypothetical protein